MSSKSSKELRDTARGLIVLAVVALLGYNWLTKPRDPVSVEVSSTSTVAEPNVTVAAAPPPPQPTAEELAAKEKDFRYAHNCLSLWDGSHDAFTRRVLDRLNDPDSFDHVDTRTWPRRDDGKNAIMMTFRARNGFGGVVTLKATGTINGSDCSEAIFGAIIE